MANTNTINIFRAIAGVAKSSVIYGLHFFARIFPRNKAIWIYSGIAGRFNDNSKYLFLHASKKFPEIRHIWLTASEEVIAMLRDKGFECYHKDSPKAIFLSLRAKVFIYSAYVTDACHLSLTGGAFLFNLWHGIPLKNIEHDIHKGPLRSIFNPVGFKEKFARFIQFPLLAKKHSAVLATSYSLRKIFSSAFGLPEDKVLVAQYPRVMPFFWSSAVLEEHILHYENISMQQLFGKIKNYKQVWIYMPTWRDSNPGFIADAIEDFEKLNQICKKNQILLLLKMHINTVFETDISAYSNIHLIDRSVDVYPLLPLTHTLITDYSSIFFDYSLLKKRIIFYAYDLKEYLSGSREFYFDYKDIVKEREVAYDFSQLLQLIEKTDFDEGGKYPVFTDFIGEINDFDEPVRFIKNAVKC